MSFSHLYRKETVRIYTGVPDADFDVVVQEISHGKISELQSAIFSNLDLSLSNPSNMQVSMMESMQKALTAGRFKATEFNDNKTLAGIESWTLLDDDGEPADIDIETWNQLPEFITDQIEKAVAKLNPDVDDEKKPS